MKRFYVCFNSVAISLLSLGLGFPGQARAAGNGENSCEGFPIHHTVKGKPGGKFDRAETYWSLSQKYYGTAEYVPAIEITTGILPERLKVGDVITIPCLDEPSADTDVTWRQAVAKVDHPEQGIVAAAPKVVANVYTPTVQSESASQAPIVEAPELKDASMISTTTLNDVVQSSAMQPRLQLAAFIAGQARPQTPPAPVETSEQLPEPQQLKAQPPTTKKVSSKKHFAATLTIPPADVKADGMVPGTFPALLLANQKPNGEYRVRREMTARIETGDNGATLCRLVFSKTPTKESMVTIDLQNGSAYPIPGEVILKLGEGTNESVPSPLAGKKTYAALRESFPKVPNRMLSVVHYVLPVAPQAAFATATLNPFAIASVPLTLVTEFGMKKIANNQRAGEVVQHPSLRIDTAYNDQQARIDALEAKIDNDQGDRNALKIMIAHQAGEIARLQQQLDAAQEAQQPAAITVAAK